MEESSGEPAAKKMRTSSSEEPATPSSVDPISMATSLMVTKLPASELGDVTVPSTDIVLTIPVVTESLDGTAATAAATTATAAAITAVATAGQELPVPAVTGTEVSALASAGNKSPVAQVPRPVAVVTNGNIRPSLQSSLGDLALKSQVPAVQTSKITTPVVSAVDSGQSQVRPSLQLNTQGIPIPIQQKWTTDGKVTFQISPSNTIRPIAQSKSPITVPASIAPAPQRYQTPQAQVVTFQHKLPPPTSILAKPPTIKPSGSTPTELKFPTQTIQKLGQSQAEVKPETPTLTSPTQISFQMPVKWNTGGSKSLLDSSNKLSVVNLNTTEAKSLLQDSKAGNGDSVMVTTGGEPQHTFKMASTAAKTFVTGGKLMGNLTTAQLITQSSGGIMSVPRTGTVVPNPMPQKIVINNKQYATQVVTQIVKTDPYKSKVTMAEAQIMLPSGPAKISWPVHSQVSTTESKQILITSPIMKTNQMTQAKTIVSQRPAVSHGGKVTTVGNVTPTAKVVEIGYPSSKSTVAGNQTVVTLNTTPTKMSVLPAQKNWELIKQAQQLMPRKIESPRKPPGEYGKSSDSSGKGSETNKPVQSETNVIKLSEIPKMKQDPVVTSSEVSSSDSDSKGSDKTETVTEGMKELEEKTEVEKEVKHEDQKEMVQKKDEKLEDIEVVKKKSEVKKQVERTGSGKTAVKIEGGEVTVRQEEFDPVDAMDWKDGVGELPGSNLKFRMNDLGVLEVISDDLECTETLNTSNESEAMETEKDLKTENREMEVDTEHKHELHPGEVSNKDEITQCVNCGEYGFTTDFYKEGRFCSQTCVGAFDSKRMRGVKKHGTMSKVVLGLKKGRKKLLLKDALNREKDIRTEPSMLGKKSKAFVWTKYLEKEKATEAPARLFKNPFPSAKNQFRTGMKLEGIDTMHQNLFCVLTVAEVCGYRIRLHFDGYSECFDFWTDIDSGYIFPVGFCEKNGKILQPPKGFAVEDFSWTNYLKLTKGVPAPKAFFSNQPVQPVTPNLFRIGSKLEAVDKKNSSLICVASVADTLGDHVLIHFDSWDDNYDYWCDLISPHIHPIGYCEENNIVLSPPIDWKDPSGFTWEKFLNKTKSTAVPARAFKPRQPVGFEVGMKVEVVDKRNQLLVRVASIAETENYMLRVHFDGWSDLYDYWLDDDSPDLHPPGWCAKTGHPLVPPISPSDLVMNSGPGICPTPGCKGIGHIKGAKYSGHHSTFGCPYSELNMNKESVVGDRLGPSIIKDDPPFSVNRVEDYGDAKVSSQPKLLSTPSEDMPKKFGRGRRPKSYYLHLEEQKREREQERLEREEMLRQGIHNSVFTSSMVTPAKSEVPLCWEQHSKLLPGVTNIRGNDVNKWTIEQVAAFVNTLPGCQEQAKLFKEEQIDGEAFLLLTQSDIVKIMNIKLGPALKIFNSIIMFKNSVEV